MSKRLGRVTVDERGIRKYRFLSFLGSVFDLTWDDIVGWDTIEAVLSGRGQEQVISRMLELQTASGVHHVSCTEGDLAALAEELRRRLPDKQRDSKLKTMEDGMYR
jgi:hypothetical protein